LADMTGARYNFYLTKDEKVVLLGALERKFWQAFCQAIGRLDLVGPPNDIVLDYGVDVSLRLELTKIFKERSEADWVELALAHDFPLSPAPRNLREWADNAHNRAREMCVTASHPVIGPFEFVASPIRADHEAYEIRCHAPARGEHTVAILAELGLDESEVKGLLADGIV
jgi:crotonobetainyl-CoA:carnitine CoA-transferase CaiB-like acyl-CoA transferase